MDAPSLSAQSLVNDDLIPNTKVKGGTVTRQLVLEIDISCSERARSGL